MMGGKRFIGITGCRKYFGPEIFKPGQLVKLVKEPENPHDSEAIKVEMEPVGKVGYVANSVQTVPKGCHSAGRIYDSFQEELTGWVRFVAGDTAIVEIAEHA